MQNRLLKELAEWATATDQTLRERLAALLGRAPDDEELGIARRLFAQALEARGGLKIHTIHGFCERLLQRFPLEAQVTPHFSVLDEREQALLRRAAFDAVVARAADESESALGQALARLIAITDGEYFRKVVDAVLGKRAELAKMVAYHRSHADWAKAEGLALKQLFGVAKDTEEALTAALAERARRCGNRRRHRRYSPACAATGKIDNGGRSCLARGANKQRRFEDRRRSEPIFLTAMG